MVGCCVFALSFCSPSWVASMACCVVSSCGVVISIFIWVLKSLMVLFPRSMLTIGHLTSLCFPSCSCSSVNVLLCLYVRSFALYLQPSRGCVLVRGWLHLVHIIGPCGLRYFLNLYTCGPHATSYASRLDLYGDCEYACIPKSIPVSLASCRSLPETPLVVAVLLMCLSSFPMPALRLVICLLFSGC